MPRHRWIRQGLRAYLGIYWIVPAVWFGLWKYPSPQTVEMEDGHLVKVYRTPRTIVGTGGEAGAIRWCVTASDGSEVTSQSIAYTNMLEETWDRVRLRQSPNGRCTAVLLDDCVLAGVHLDPMAWYPASGQGGMPLDDKNRLLTRLRATLENPKLLLSDGTNGTPQPTTLYQEFWVGWLP